MDHLILQVKTVALLGENKVITYISGKFFGSGGQVVADTTSGWLDIQESESTVARIGDKDFAAPISAAQMDFLRVLVNTRGAINHMQSGSFKGADLDIDGAYLTQFQAIECNVRITTVFWADKGTVLLRGNTLYTGEPATFYRELMGTSKFQGMATGFPPQPPPGDDAPSK